ncbi:HEAT repeat domain-containing protein [Herpetosiphon llansteffanensis]|uniref:HEAT repeat domain-containing protein n=1 Tax=Herpetosiphon llansteffanensis TaxID=2094568 RepID=UPI000D7D22E7|nr:HEAT repeat domain-containing protein [Herpetosiphon llansteffanensis]
MAHPRLVRLLSLVLLTALIVQLGLIPQSVAAQTKTKQATPASELPATPKGLNYYYPSDDIYQYSWSTLVETVSTTQEQSSGVRNHSNSFNLQGSLWVERYASDGYSTYLQAQIVKPSIYNKTEAGLKQITDPEVVGPASDAELARPFYFQQDRDGVISGLYFDGADSEDVQNIKRAALSQLQIYLYYEPECADPTQIDCVAAYSKSESDVSGVYTADYSSRMLDAQTVEITKKRSEKSYKSFADRSIANAEATKIESTSVAIYDLRAGVLLKNTTTQRIRSGFNSTNGLNDYEGSGYAIESGGDSTDAISFEGTIPGEIVPHAFEGKANTNAISTLIRSIAGKEYKSVEIVANVSSNKADADLGLAAADLTTALKELADAPSDPNAVSRLRATLNTVDGALSQLDQQLSKGRINPALYEGIIGALTGVVDSQAQRLIITHLVNNQSLNQTTRTQALTALTVIAEPSDATIIAVSDLVQANGSDAKQALLVLGAIANNLWAKQPELAQKLSAMLETKLAEAKTDIERDLALRALGNAGPATTLSIISGYLEHSNEIVRTSAIDALRKFPAAETEALLLKAYSSETSAVARHAARELLFANSDAPRLNAFDWNWQKFVGGGDLKGELKARLYLSNGPDITALAHGEAKAHAWSWSYSLAEAKATSYVQTENGIKYRYFEAYVKVLGNNVFTPIKERVACGVQRTGNLYQTTMTFFSVTKTFMVGPIPIQLGLSASGSISIPWKIVATACDVPISASANVSITPTVWASASATAAVTIFIARGGIGINADFLKTSLEAKASATYHITNGFHGNLGLNVSVQPLAVRIFLWYQLRKLFGGWKSRNEWTIWNWSAATQTWPIWNTNF